MLTAFSKLHKASDSQHPGAHTTHEAYRGEDYGVGNPGTTSTGRHEHMGTDGPIGR